MYRMHTLCRKYVDVQSMFLYLYIILNGHLSTQRRVFYDAERCDPQNVGSNLGVSSSCMFVKCSGIYLMWELPFNKRKKETNAKIIL